MQAGQAKSKKPPTKPRGKVPKPKPTPAAPIPSPSVNGHSEAAEPFDTPPRCFYISAAQIRIEKLSFLWDPYIPENSLTMLTGDSGAGKSTLLSAIGAGVTRGYKMQGSGGHERHRVLVFSPEEQVQVSVRSRLDAHNANLPMVFFGDYDFAGHLLPRMALPSDCSRLAERIKVMRIRLVTIDPITSYLGSGFNPSNDSEVRHLLDTLSQICTECQCTIIITRHYRKSLDGSPLDRIGGSAAWGHFPRTVIACGYDPDDPEKRVMASSKWMTGKAPPSLRYTIEQVDETVKLVLGETTSITARDMGVSALPPSERDALADAEDFLRNALAEGPQPCNDLKGFALRNMISEVTLRRAKKKMGVISQLVVSAGDRFHTWRLPDIQVAK